MAQKYSGKVRFVSENWGESKLAEQFGIKRYPVVFVDDVLVAQPDDFGWFGAKGKYSPWREPANHAKFVKDLSRIIDLTLSGNKTAAGKTEVRTEDVGLASLPSFTASDPNGKAVGTSELSGKVVIVEFWATWCLPCRSTLSWLNEVKHRYGNQVEIVAAAVESEAAEVRKFAESLDPSIRVIAASPELVTQFNDISSVPTMYVFDRSGKTAKVFLGAPKDLHQNVGKLLDSLVK